MINEIISFFLYIVPFLSLITPFLSLAISLATLCLAYKAYNSWKTKIFYDETRQLLAKYIHLENLIRDIGDLIEELNDYDRIPERNWIFNELVLDLKVDIDEINLLRKNIDENIYQLQSGLADKGLNSKVKIIEKIIPEWNEVKYCIHKNRGIFYQIENAIFTHKKGPFPTKDYKFDEIFHFPSIHGDIEKTKSLIKNLLSSF